MSAALGQICDVSSKGVYDALKHQQRGVAKSSLDAAQVGLMDVGTMRQLLLREAAVTPERLQIEADSDPHIHGRMAGSDLTSAHRL